MGEGIGSSMPSDKPKSVDAHISYTDALPLAPGIPRILYPQILK